MIRLIAGIPNGPTAVPEDVKVSVEVGADVALGAFATSARYVVRLPASMTKSDQCKNVLRYLNGVLIELKSTYHE